jgi:hypothetical protein
MREMMILVTLSFIRQTKNCPAVLQWNFLTSLWSELDPLDFAEQRVVRKVLA